MSKYTFKRYNSQFPKLFEKEKIRINTIFKNEAIIEHIGSTAVRGLGGKGIIDVAISAPIEKMKSYKKHLQALDYIFSEHDSTNERFFFSQDLPYNKTKQRYHVHIILNTSDEWKRVISFRDFLRTSKEYQKKYSDLKKKAAKIANNDPIIYKIIKEPLIHEIIQKVLET